eukprot:TRINITY_DN4146_c1_g1_i1.p1 TRINITY_DN4146_c1_g1~~TRINITY_DN4146_c1_g1_i1.p1  ORF type:complete len:831 (+),score=117.22 TRINITY_DN4146_c1_g1_i1:74-2566(+)
MAVGCQGHEGTDWVSLTHINASCVFVILIIAGIAGNVLLLMVDEGTGVELTTVSLTFSILGTVGIGLVGLCLGLLHFPALGVQTATFGLSALSFACSCVSALDAETLERKQVGLLAISLTYKFFAVAFGWTNQCCSVWAGFTTVLGISCQLYAAQTDAWTATAAYIITAELTVAMVALTLAFIRNKALKAVYVTWQNAAGEKEVYEKVTSLSCDGELWVAMDDNRGVVICRMSPQLDMLLCCSQTERTPSNRLRAYFKDQKSYTALVNAMKGIDTAPLLHPTQMRNAWGDTLSVELIVVPHQMIDKKGSQNAGYMIAVRMYQQTMQNYMQDSPDQHRVSPQTPLYSCTPQEGPLLNVMNSAGSGGGSPASVVSQAAIQMAAIAQQQARSSNTLTAETVGRPAGQPPTPQTSGPSAQLVTPVSAQGPDGSENTVNAFSSGAMVDLSDLIEIGKKEHWLIECPEVELQPQMLLGKGGFGAVVEATFYGAKLAAKFAKEVKPIDLSEIHSSSSMVHELRMLRLARHPNIVSFYGACIEPGTREIVLLFENVQAPTLTHFITKEHKERRENSLTLGKSDQKLVKVFVDVCRALHYLHSRSPALVHGDLKASNVFVTREQEAEPHAVLADFGLAVQVLATTRPMGFTMRWAAPEVMLNGLLAPSTAADVFAFGRLMTYVVTGQMPLPGLKESDISALLYSGSRLPSPNFPESVLTRSCSHIVHMCLEFFPADRVSTRDLHTMIELLPEVITDAYRESGSQSSASAGNISQASQDENLMSIVPLLPGTTGASEVASTGDVVVQAAAPARMDRSSDTQRWIRRLQQAREAAAADELL